MVVCPSTIAKSVGVTPGDRQRRAVVQLVKSLQRCEGCWFHPKLLHKTFMKVSLRRHWIPKQPLKRRLHQSVMPIFAKSSHKEFLPENTRTGGCPLVSCAVIDNCRFTLITCNRFKSHRDTVSDYSFRITICSYACFRLMHDMYPASLTGLPGPQTWIRSSISETSSIAALTAPMLHCRGDWSNRGLEGHPQWDHLLSPQ